MREGGERGGGERGEIGESGERVEIEERGGEERGERGRSIVF